MRVAVLSANLNTFEKPAEQVPQISPAGVSLTFHTFTDANWPPRFRNE